MIQDANHLTRKAVQTMQARQGRTTNSSPEERVVRRILRHLGDDAFGTISTPYDEGTREAALDVLDTVVHGPGLA